MQGSINNQISRFFINDENIASHPIVRISTLQKSKQGTINIEFSGFTFPYPGKVKDFALALQALKSMKPQK